MPIAINKVNFNKHYLVSTSEEITAIAQPLFKFGITMFDHFRIYDDNSAIDLTTAPEFCEFFTKNHLYREGCVGNYNDYHDGYFFWDTLLGADPVFKALEQQCHFAHGIIVVKTYKNYCDHFHFGADIKNPGIKNFFINQKDLIEQFIQYYYQEAKHLIDNARPHSYSFPDDKKECGEILEISNSSAVNIKRHFELNKTSKLNIAIKLTKRELECIFHSSQGKPAKIVADELNIAQKTVERHLENSRHKLGVKNKIALFNAVAKLNPNFLLLAEK